MWRRGVKKNGGKVRLRSHVDRILIEGGRAAGVVLKGGQVIRAAKAVVSNASMWDTIGLLPEDHVPPSYRKQARVPAHLPALPPPPPGDSPGPCASSSNCSITVSRLSGSCSTILQIGHDADPGTRTRSPRASRTSCRMGR